MPIRKRTASAAAFILLREGLPIANPIPEISCTWLVAGARTFGYHLVNLLLHAVVTVLVYLLLQYLLESSPQASTLAFTAALLLPYIPFTPKRSPASWAAPNCLRPDFFSRPGYCICATAIF